MGKLAANTKDIDLGEEADELRVESVVAEVVLLAGARGRLVGATLAVGLAAPAAALSPGAVAESRSGFTKLVGTGPV